MDLVLQIWGGLFYLANKALFAFAGNRAFEARRRLLVCAWSAYLVGVPAWILILVGRNNWIAASVEAGGIPAMLLGLYSTLKHDQAPNPVFRKAVSVVTYLSIAFGFALSLVEYGGIVSISQVLEIGVMFGFLLGGYLMATSDSRGWLFFALMNISMAILMLIQDRHILMAQQLASLSFVIYGYRKALR